MDEKPDINNLINENEILKKQLEEQKNSYKKLSSELGQSIFEYEELDLKNRNLKKENDELKKEIEEIKNEIEEIKSSRGWKIIKLFR